MQEAFILQENENRSGQPYNVFGMNVYLKVAGSDTNGQMSMFFGEYQKNQGPPLHTHDLDETFFITQGAFMYQLGDQRVQAGPGDTLFVPRNLPHSFIALQDHSKGLFMVSPSHTMETLFERLSAYTDLPPMEEVVRLHEELGLKILGPPMSAE